MKKYNGLLALFLAITILSLIFGELSHLENKAIAEELAIVANLQKNTVTTVITVKVPIYSLALNNEIGGQLDGSSSLNGSFFLGFGGISGTGNIHGSVDETTFYYFYKDMGNGHIILSKSNAESTALIKTTKAPYLETVTSVTKVFNTPKESHIISQTLYVPMNYKLLGGFKK